MILRLLILLFACGAFPAYSHAAQLRTIEVELLFDASAVPDKTLSGYKLYQNGTLVCETTDPAATLITCEFYTEDGTHSYTLAAHYTDGTDSPESPPFQFTIGDTQVTFTWAYSDATSSAGGFHVYSNKTLLCQTIDPTARSLSCTIDILQPDHTFNIAAVDAGGILTTFSNTIVYSTAAATPTPPPTEELAVVISVNPSSGPTPLVTSFDGSGSTGDIATYNWSFGDGDKASGATASHTYSTPGTYSASLEVSDTLGGTAISSVTIIAEEEVITTSPPTAVISSSTAAGEAPLDVTFDGSQSTAVDSYITNYSWDFGDGSKGTGQTVAHTFSLAGTFNTELAVTDSAGLTDTETTPVVVTEPTTTNQLPTAAFEANPNTGSTPLTVSFDASSSTDPDGIIAGYLWNYGDGTAGSGKTPQHTYSTTASFTVTLEVTDDAGSTSPPVTKTITTEGEQQEVVLNYEAGEIDLTHEWVRVNLQNTFTNPAVIISPPTNKDPEPTVARVRNVDQQGFEVRLQEWDYLDGVHKTEKIAFLVLEQGEMTFPDGTMIEVGTFNATTRKISKTFRKLFTSPPVVLTTIVTYNGSNAVAGRLSTVSETGFTYMLQEQEKNQQKHTNELVAYLAWSTGAGTVDTIQFAASVAADALTNNPTIYTFADAFSSLPFFFADMQTTNDRNPASVRLQNLTNAGAEIFIQEEQSKDDELTHIAESIGYLALSDTGITSPADKTLTFNWEFDSNEQSSITGFRVFNSGRQICEILDPAARTLTCTAAVGKTNSYTIKAIETTGLETNASNAINYTQ